jgi:hypothetical protein
MHAQDRQAIEALFVRLADIERRSAPRDPDAEAFIRQRMSEQHGAPYFMAQTIVMQQQALEEAQRRIDALERAPSRGAPEARGVPERSSLFGNREPERALPQGRDQSAGGRGGFLAGAAQTAMGVAGGMLLGNMLGGLFGGSRPAEAAPPAAAPPNAEQGAPAAAEEGGGLDSWFGGDEEM